MQFSDSLVLFAENAQIEAQRIPFADEASQDFGIVIHDFRLQRFDGHGFACLGIDAAVHALDRLEEGLLTLFAPRRSASLQQSSGLLMDKVRAEIAEQEKNRV